MRKISICLLENTGLMGIRQAGEKKEEKCHDSQIGTEKICNTQKNINKKGIPWP